MKLCGSFTMPFPVLLHQIFLKFIVCIGILNFIVQSGSALLLGAMSKQTSTTTSLLEGLLHEIANMDEQIFGHSEPATKEPL